MTILFFNIPAQGHINPSLPVIKELVQRGETVFYFNTDEYRAACESTGATFVSYPNSDEYAQLMNSAVKGNIANNAVMLLNMMFDLLPWVMEQINQYKPDLLIFDSLASWGNMASRITHLPSVSFSTTFAINAQALPDISPLEIAQLLMNFVRVMPQYWQVRSKVRKQYPQVKMIGLTEALSNYGDCNIVFTAKEFQPASHTFDKSYKFVGASIQTRHHDTGFPFDELTGSPLVYISLGTINNNQAEFYKMCFEAFGNQSGQFILSVGKTTDIASLGRIPDNFVVKNFVPQLEILERVHVFVTHGGMNSVHEGLYYGVPMVVIPQQAEQSGVASQVAKSGAGILLKTPTVEGLRDGVAKIMSRADYQQNSARLGDSLREAGGYQKAADEILAFIATDSTKKDKI